MNRTIEQWTEISCVVPVAGATANTVALLQAIQDLQELARQLESVKSALCDERAAWSAKRMELLRSISSEQVLRTGAQRQRDELAEALELCMTAVKLAGWDGDYCMDKARSALQSIKEQTK